MQIDKIKERLKTWEEESSRREKILLIIVTIILPLFLFFKFYYFPSKNQIKLIQEEIKKLDLEISKLEGYVKKEKEIELIINNRKTFLEEIKSILPSQQEVPQLMKEVSSKAKKYGLEIVSFTPKTEEKRDYYNVIPFEMQLKGSFLEIIKFLIDVERMPRLVTLSAAEFQPLEKEEKLVLKGIFHTYTYTGEPLQKTQEKK